MNEKIQAKVVYPISVLERDFADRIQWGIDQGFERIKIKIGFDPDQDSKTINTLRDLALSKVKIRLDANQGFSLKGAIHFCQSISSELLPRVEFLEQPLLREHWDELNALTSKISLPMLLDEDIYTLPDLEKANSLGIQHVKLKLCKHGGLNEILEMANRAKQYGQEIILGNGISTNISNYLELWLAYRYPNLFNPWSEANGFLKMKIETPSVSHHSKGQTVSLSPPGFLHQPPT